ncbi:MAG: hypothetical protein JWO09_1758 [Bacteroidetes bacterium]|nr:hypothetical protein [Bacteroidota bacterium]
MKGLKSALMRLPVLQILFAAIILFQAMVIIALPLIPSMNDSAWYYMNVHYVKTGAYICESMYPSFHEPSQYYPVLGYSLFLFCCDAVAGLLHADWATLAKFLQFLFYILSAFLVKALVIKQTGRVHLSYLIAIIYLLYYPHFNYCNFVMSETYAGFLLLLMAYLFISLQKNYKTSRAVMLFLAAGCSMLVKPVFLVIVLLLLLFFSLEAIRLKRYSRLACMLSVLVFPISQSVFSKTHYGNYSLQTGLGWHLWDRVIHYDKLIPTNSAALQELQEIHARHGKALSYGFWWDITKSLSELGYTEQQTQKICKDVSLDGISENIFPYALNTFHHSGTTFLTAPLSGDVYAGTEGYRNKILGFSGEPQHAPLTVRLLEQGCFKTPSAFRDGLLRINYRISQLSDPLSVIFHNGLILFLYLLAGIFNLYLLVKSRLRKHAGLFIIWFIPFATCVCSNMLEYSQPRFLIPAFIFVIMSLTCTSAHILETIKQDKIKKQ